MEKDVYICYNGADLEWVRSLAEQIESETIDGLPQSRPLSVFFDKWDIGPGQSLIDRMNQGMAGSRHVITVLSPEFLKADWPRFEWKHILAQNPNNVGERIIPLMLRDISLDGKERIELCAPFRDFRYVDFRKLTEFKRSYNELIRRIRNLPAERGRKLPPLAGRNAVLPINHAVEVSWLPDKVPDLLLANLLRVQQIPRSVWGAETKFRHPKDLYQEVPNAEPFILRDGCLFTFADLSREKTSLRLAVDSKTVRSDSYFDWLMREDRRAWLMALLNTCLGKHLRKQRIFKDEKGRFYFAPNEDGTDRKWIARVTKPITVAAKKGENDSSFWVHYAARMRFRRLGDALFLSIEPVFLFTINGYGAVKGKEAGKLSLQWGGKQQNPDILRNLLFWTIVLSTEDQSVSIYTGNKPIVLDSLPATSRIDKGIAQDHIKMKTLLEQADKSLNDAASGREVEDDDESNEENES